MKLRGIAICTLVFSSFLLAPNDILAAGYTKTKEQCRKLGGEPTGKNERGEYFCLTIKKDQQCKQKNKNDPDYYCYQYNVKTRKCELDIQGLALDDCY